MTNCILIGELAGVELPDDSDGVIILGDDIVNLDRNQPNVLFLSEKCAIGGTIFGKKFNLKKLILQYRLSGQILLLASRATGKNNP